MPHTITTCTHKTAVGELVIGDFQGELCLLDYRYRRMRATVDRRVQKELGATYQDGETDLLAEARAQLDAYLLGQRTAFDLPLRLAGSDFSRRVWDALLAIPYGSTTSYGDLARTLGDPNAARAVARANGANAIAIVIPCHRVIGADGSLVGYGGGLAAKKRLLRLEGALES